MSAFTALYFDGTNARPYEVRVMVLQEELQLIGTTDDELLVQVSYAGMHQHQLRGTCYIYLDAKGLQYLQADCNAVKESGLVQQVRRLIQTWPKD